MKSRRPELGIAIGAVACMCACTPQPKPPLTHAWDAPNNQCPWLSANVAYCCSCSPDDARISRRIQELGQYTGLGRNTEECLSQSVHNWRTQGGTSPTTDAAKNVVEHCTRQSTDPGATHELIQLVQQIYATPSDPHWQECFAKTMHEQTCERIRLAQEQERKDEESRIAQEEREHKRSMESMQALGSVVAGLTSAGAQQGVASSSTPASQSRWESVEQPVPDEAGYGHGHVAWVVGGRTYGACVQVSGARGQAVVFDQSSGLAVVEDLALDRQGRTMRWIGSHPREQRSGASAAAYYAPDIFVLAQVPNGSWDFAAVCDLTGQCSPAQALPVDH